MDHVASCQGCMACNHDASDDGVAQINRPTFALPGGHQVCGLPSRERPALAGSETARLEASSDGVLAIATTC